jgi:diaminohydroxyphosphoribosylaminopyrimidine deaminase/5-amino-6-(5-phosphoribosylamino)uracil reductase
MGGEARVDRDAGRGAEDARWMRLALALAGLGRGRTHPNPRVGAVAVRDAHVLGIGAHLEFGGPHAEAALLASAPVDALRGATVYVNLEPCAHHGKTPPCAPTLARAGVARVVASIEDPDPRVRGRGLAGLREAGIEVETGPLAGAARRLNAPFLGWQARRRSWVLLKLATTLDGRIAAADGSSRWISSPLAREHVHRWRAGADAILVGRGTWVADLPRLTARPSRDPRARLRARAGDTRGWPPQPARIVLDSRCRTAESDALLDHLSGSPGGPWIFACGRHAPETHRKRLEALGARCWVLPETGAGAGIDLAALMTRLGEEGRLEVFVEGGASVATGLLRAGLVDELRLIVAPSLLGGERVWLRDLGIGSIDGKLGWGRLRARRLGRDLLLSGLSPAAEAMLDGRAAAVEESPCSRA